MPALRVILGDQLSKNISSLQELDRVNDRVLMMEVMEEAESVKHHKQKLVFVFSAMRHFAKSLEADGIKVIYLKLDDIKNRQNFYDNIDYIAWREQLDNVILTEPSEHRVLEAMENWMDRTSLDVTLLEDGRFLATKAEFANWANGKKSLVMEHFYRIMRRKHDLLMDQGKPVGGKWNYDADNRKPYRGEPPLPKRYVFKKDAITEEVIKLVKKHFPQNFGHLEKFNYAVTETDAKRALSQFIQQYLPYFGDFQDAMSDSEPFLFHSLLSAYINVGLLEPKHICRLVSQAYKKGDVPLNAAEGFIRQLIGWREFVRGIYWLNMPRYAHLNELDAREKLPEFYWTGKTQMNCMRSAIGSTMEYAYAHHIQRLMVTGNFAMLLGVKPAAICEWYLIVYIDAFDWVELPNTLGMSQFADGGVFATKPYAASGNYINKQSDYCRTCQYNVKARTGDDACPFNFLYWDFLMRHEKRLSKNLRMKYAYFALAKMDQKDRLAIRSQAERFRKSLS